MARCPKLHVLNGRGKSRRPNQGDRGAPCAFSGWISVVKALLDANSQLHSCPRSSPQLQSPPVPVVDKVGTGEVTIRATSGEG